MSHSLANLKCIHLKMTNTIIINNIIALLKGGPNPEVASCKVNKMYSFAIDKIKDMKKVRCF